MNSSTDGAMNSSMVTDKFESEENPGRGTPNQCGFTGLAPDKQTL